MIATFAERLLRRLDSSARRVLDLWARAYDPALSASQKPESATDARQKLLQRRVDKKRGNTKASELSIYEQRRSILARGQG